MKKIAVILIYSFLIIKTGQAQVLNGKYIQQQYSEYGNIFNFESNRFTDTTFLHMDNKIVGKGTYKFKNNQLILNYEHIPNQDSSRYILAKKKTKTRDIGQIFIKVYDAEDNNKPLYFAFCGLKDNQDNLLVAFYSDTLGKANISIYNSKIFKTLSITCLGYNTVSIPVSQIMGTNTDLTVFLKFQTTQYLNKSKIVYTIEKLTLKELVLITKEKTRIRFKKIE
ncbi:MAG: hypothetical protein WBP45_06775 [Daejeonella sp.]